MYSAAGNELEYPLQILDPLKCSLFLSMDTKHDKQFIEMSFVTLSNIDLKVSMRDYALVQAILSSVRDMIESDKTENIDNKSSTLDEDEIAQIEKIALELGIEESSSKAASSSGVEVVIRSDNIIVIILFVILVEDSLKGQSIGRSR